MIDLHSHILPSMDDGSKSMEMSLEMGRIAVAEGTTYMACTPHFMSGVYDTTMQMLAVGIKNLRQEFGRHGIALKLVSGGDVHVRPDLAEMLAQRSLPTLGKSSYFLFEPPHHVTPPGLVELCRKLHKAAYRPILTHPERLSWIEQRYSLICELSDLGVPIQVTARSVTGEFGSRPKYWCDRLFEEGRVDIVASDAHNLTSRPPGLRVARDFVLKHYGEDAAKRIFHINPVRVLKDEPIESVEKTRVPEPKQKTSFLRKLFPGS